MIDGIPVFLPIIGLVRTQKLIFQLGFKSATLNLCVGAILITQQGIPNTPTGSRSPGPGLFAGYLLEISHMNDAKILLMVISSKEIPLTGPRKERQGFLDVIPPTQVLPLVDWKGIDGESGMRIG